MSPQGITGGGDPLIPPIGKENIATFQEEKESSPKKTMMEF